MCFFVHEDHPTVKIATKNIVCYKRLDVTDCHSSVIKINLKTLSSVRFKTPYREEPIHLDKKPLMTTSLDKSRLRFNEIKQGLHSYSNKRVALQSSRTWEVVVQCIIPKGASYYYNSWRKEYVSNQLQYTKKITSRKNSPFTIAPNLQIK